MYLEIIRTFIRPPEQAAAAWTGKAILVILCEVYDVAGIGRAKLFRWIRARPEPPAHMHEAENGYLVPSRQSSRDHEVMDQEVLRLAWQSNCINKMGCNAANRSALKELLARRGR